MKNFHRARSWSDSFRRPLPTLMEFDNLGRGRRGGFVESLIHMFYSLLGLGLTFVAWGVIVILVALDRRLWPECAECGTALPPGYDLKLCPHCAAKGETQ